MFLFTYLITDISIVIHTTLSVSQSLLCTRDRRETGGWPVCVGSENTALLSRCWRHTRRGVLIQHDTTGRRPTVNWRLLAGTPETITRTTSSTHSTQYSTQYTVG